MPRHYQGEKERRNAGLTVSTVPCYRGKLFWAQCTYWVLGAAGGSQAPVEGPLGDHGPDETGCPRSAPA